MKKRIDKKTKDQKIKKKIVFPLTTENYQIFGIGILVIILGYISLSKGPADSFWSLTLAPILLVIGYCVIIPIAIMYRKRKKEIYSVQVRQALKKTGRPLLHAGYLQFIHPESGSRLEFTVPPPEDFMRVLQTVRTAV